jgi:hypothetical protein
LYHGLDAILKLVVLKVISGNANVVLLALGVRLCRGLALRMTPQAKLDLRRSAVGPLYGDAANRFRCDIDWQCLACKLLKERNLRGATRTTWMRDNERLVHLQFCLPAYGTRVDC